MKLNVTSSRSSASKPDEAEQKVLWRYRERVGRQTRDERVVKGMLTLKHCLLIALSSRLEAVENATSC
jgi:hypothetical protein